MAKSVANYANSALIKMEAVLDGYSEGIALDPDGHLSEGSGQNLFLVRDEVLYTPPLSASVLPGITRDSASSRSRGDLGLTVREMDLPREMLYVADEVFFVGTAAEITPIRSVDKINDRHRRAGADHHRSAARVLRLHQRRAARPARLADARRDPGRRQARARRRAGPVDLIARATAVGSPSVLRLNSGFLRPNGRPGAACPDPPGRQAICNSEIAPRGSLRGQGGRGLPA